MTKKITTVYLNEESLKQVNEEMAKQILEYPDKKRPSVSKIIEKLILEHLKKETGGKTTLVL